MLVHTPGAVVSCPHCGTQVTAPDFSDTPDQPEPPSASSADPAPAAERVPTDSQLPADDPPVEEPETVEPGGSIFDDETESPAEPDTDGDGGTGTDNATDPEDAAAEPPVAENPPTLLEPTPAVAGKPAARSVSRQLFVLVLSYASAMTFVCIWLATRLAQDPHGLESLPDPKQLQESGGTVTGFLLPESEPMPPGHTLRLGESQRFGNVRIKPLRVTRDMLRFTSHSNPGDSLRHKPVGPVVKLWLELENVSSGQDFAPLDRYLLLWRDGSAARDRANNFLCRSDQKSNPDGRRVLVHNNAFDGDRNWEDQQADGLEGLVLKPGETFKTYIPSEASGLDGLTGELIWRVHFRKGFSTRSNKGVTTVIEIAFHSDQIVDEVRATSSR